MIKAPFFAVIIAHGRLLRGVSGVSGSAESVGRLTTQSVVESIFLVIVTDAAFSIFFSMLQDLSDGRIEPGESIIRVRGLVNRFGAETVHDGLDLDVRRGEVLGVVGGSGTGKSVLLRTIIGLNRPAAGRVEVLGSDCSER